MDDEQKPFAVTDRRRSTTATAEPPEETPGKAGPSGPSDLSEAEASEVDDEAGLSFTGFLAGLAAQATVLLGLGPPSGGERSKPDLGAARHMISILEMLREKTEGRRTPEEDRVLGAILYELRMAYVRVAGEAGR